MATHFNGNISFQNSITASNIIVRGIVNKIISEKEEKYEHGMLLFRVYELLVDEVLYGQYNTKTLAIRTVSYDDSKAQAIQLEEGKEMVFVLSRDFAKDQPENQYTIVQGNYYEVAENKLHLPIYSASNENSQNIAELKQMSIKDLRTEIKNIVKSKIQKAPASETRFGKKLGKMITKDSNVLDFEQFKIYDSQINSVQ